MSDKTYHVYIMTNASRSSTYTGVTSNLCQRVLQHRDGVYAGFSKKYRTKVLVYYDATTDARGAIEREKQIKRWRREKKMALINSVNPSWRDLATDLGFPPLSQKRQPDLDRTSGLSARVNLRRNHSR